MTKFEQQRRKRIVFAVVIIATFAVLGPLACAALAQEQVVSDPLTTVEARGQCTGLVADPNSTLWTRCVQLLTASTSTEGDFQDFLDAADEARYQLSLISINPAEQVGESVVTVKVPKPVSVTIGLKAADKYLGGNGGVFHPGAVTQNDITFEFRGGCYANFWVSQGFDDTDFSSNFGDELDYSIGCASSRWGLDFDLGLIYIDTHKLGESPDGDVWGPYLSLGRTGKSGLGASLKLEPYIGGGGGAEGGWLIHLRGSYTRTLFSNVTATISGGPTYDDGAFGFRTGVIGFAELELSVPWKGVTFNPFYKASMPLSGADDRESQNAYGLALGFKAR